LITDEIPLLFYTPWQVLGASSKRFQVKLMAPKKRAPSSKSKVFQAMREDWITAYFIFSAKAGSSEPGFFTYKISTDGWLSGRKN